MGWRGRDGIGDGDRDGDKGGHGDFAVTLRDVKAESPVLKILTSPLT